MDQEDSDRLYDGEGPSELEEVKIPEPHELDVSELASLITQEERKDEDDEF